MSDQTIVSAHVKDISDLGVVVLVACGFFLACGMLIGAAIIGSVAMSYAKPPLQTRSHTPF